MNNGFVPEKATVTRDSSIVINFDYYNNKKSELEKINKPGLLRKFLRFIIQVGQCQDITELKNFLKAHNTCDMSSSKFQKLLPKDIGLKIYEVWHGKHTGERIFYTRAGFTFYPVLFLQNHP